MIKIKIGIAIFARMNLSFLNLIKNIIKNGMSKTIPSYLTNVKRARIANDAKISFLLLLRRKNNDVENRKINGVIVPPINESIIRRGDRIKNNAPSKL